MSKGVCTFCPKKCHWSAHGNLEYTYEHTTRMEKVTLNEIKKRYQGAKEETLKYSDLYSKMNEDFIQLQINVMSLANDVRKSIKYLGEIALKPNSLGSTIQFDLMISAEESNITPGRSERLAQLRRVREEVKWMEEVANDRDPFVEYTKKLASHSKSDFIKAALKDYKRSMEPIGFGEPIRN